VSVKKIFSFLADLFAFCIVAVGHPAVFLIFFYLELPGSIIEMPNQVYSINLPIFLPFALTLYAVWQGLIFFITRRTSGLNFADYLETAMTGGTVTISFFGCFNILAWAIGFNINLSVIFIFPILLMLLVLSFILFIKQILRLYRKT